MKANLQVFQNKARSFLSKIKYIHHHILGMNLRNSEFIFKHNPIHLYALVDNKIQTKLALQEKAIPTPKMYFYLDTYFELKESLSRLRKLEKFVLKPANGFGGEGVLLIQELQNHNFITPGGRAFSNSDLLSHMQDIFSGIYSLNQAPDQLLCEEKLESHPLMAELTHKGIPDLRIVLFQGVPILSMLRLSTFKSQGRANLHQGGIGVGIDLETGKTKHAIYAKKYIQQHPDNGANLLNFEIPQFQETLLLASRCYDAAPLGYMGADIVFDEHKGPLVLELNVRPGLMIQMANRLGIRPLLAEINQTPLHQLSHTEKVALGQSLYKKHKLA